VATPAELVAAQLTPPGTVLLTERVGDVGSALEPGELERTRRRGYAVGAAERHAQPITTDNKTAA